MWSDRNGNPLHSGDVVTVQCTVEEVYSDGWCNLRICPPGSSARFNSFAAPAATVARNGAGRQSFPTSGAQPPPSDEEPKPASAAR